jgi:hypothetical protein
MARVYRAFDERRAIQTPLLETALWPAAELSIDNYIGTTQAPKTRFFCGRNLFFVRHKSGGLQVENPVKQLKSAWLWTPDATL